MNVIDIYKQYFRANCIFNDIPRRGAVVCLTSTSEDGNIKYEVSVSFFPYREQEDFAITGDAYAVREIYSKRGRRSRKREAIFLEELPAQVDELAASLGGAVLWDEPLTEARMG